MTKVIRINCHMWLRVIAVILWSGFTIGIGYAVYYTNDHTINGNIVHCKEQTNFTKDWYDICLTQTKWNPIILYLVSIVNIANVFSIWLVINHKYKFVEFKCKS